PGGHHRAGGIGGARSARVDGRRLAIAIRETGGINLEQKTRSGWWCRPGGGAKRPPGWLASSGNAVSPGLFFLFQESRKTRALKASEVIIARLANLTEDVRLDPNGAGDRQIGNDGVRTLDALQAFEQVRHDGGRPTLANHACVSERTAAERRDDQA